MKSITLFLSIFFAVATATAQHRLSLGLVQHRDTVMVKWSIENSTNKPLLIVDTEVDCDCTWSKYSRKPIKPSRSQQVELYLYADKQGNFLKRIDFILSDGSKRSVSLIGRVEK